MLTALELTFMRVPRSNSGLFNSPGFLVSPVVKRVGGKIKRRRREKGNRTGKVGGEKE